MDGDLRQPETRAPAAEPVSIAAPRRRRLPFVVFGLLLLVLAGAGGWEWYANRNLESTDDAFIDGNVSQVAPQVAGRVIAIEVRDNQEVTAGQPLVRLDPRDEQVRLDQARAQQASARAQLTQAVAQRGVQEASVKQAEAQVHVAEADLFQAQQDYNRFKAIDPHAISRQQLDNATATLRSAEARLDASRRAAAAAAAQLAVIGAQEEAARAAIRTADAAVEQAELDLSYTTVTAPRAGRVTKRSVELGNYAKAGSVLMYIVPDEVWVTANFKETQLARMHPGQAVDLRVDAYPGITFHGKVDSFQAGTGSVFSVLPAENATGNYVKVVQRLPVKIVFDDPRVKDYPLSPGMSVVPVVHLR